MQLGFQMRILLWYEMGHKTLKWTIPMGTFLAIPLRTFLGAWTIPMRTFQVIRGLGGAHSSRGLLKASICLKTYTNMSQSPFSSSSGPREKIPYDPVFLK